MIAKVKNLCALLLIAPAALYAQGSLTPPTGPAPSMKTLGQIEPRTAIGTLPFAITQEGSYYLTTNLVVPNGANGITIQAGHVSLDLGGFTIKAAANGLDSIVVSGPGNVTIANGMIVSSGAGIAAAGTAKVTVQDVTVAGALGDGISVGDDSVVIRCKVSSADGAGIRTGARAQVSNSQASQNLDTGIVVGAGSTVRDSQSSRNSSGGILAGNHSKLLAATASENAGVGIDAANNANIVDCAASQNQQGGIRAAGYGLVTRATASFNSIFGVNVGTGGSVLESNVSANSWVGINAGTSAQIANCTVEGNASTLR